MPKPKAECTKHLALFASSAASSGSAADICSNLQASRQAGRRGEDSKFDGALRAGAACGHNAWAAAAAAEAALGQTSVAARTRPCSPSSCPWPCAPAASAWPKRPCGGRGGGRWNGEAGARDGGAPLRARSIAPARTQAGTAGTSGAAAHCFCCSPLPTSWSEPYTSHCTLSCSIAGRQGEGS